MERSRELKGILLGIYHDWSSGDHSWIELFAEDDDVLAIGTDATEWWQGGRNAIAVFRQQMAEMGALTIESPPGSHVLEAIRPGHMQAYVSGDVGWVADQPVAVLDGDIQFQLRITAVFERRGGEWRIVQWHASLPQNNEEVLGYELTTSIDVLAEAMERNQPDLAPIASTEGTVTILFTDIEGSTALNERLGDQRWSEVVRAHDVFTRKTVATHGGTTVERIGDGFMLAFPSARKAVECAVTMQRRLGPSQGDDVSFRMRVGVHTGEPIREAGAFYGRDVAYAARVGSVAEGGEILVSNLVKELCRGAAFAFDGPRVCEFKGFDGPQPVFAVQWTP